MKTLYVCSALVLATSGAAHAATLAGSLELTVDGTYINASDEVTLTFSHVDSAFGRGICGVETFGATLRDGESGVFVFNAANTPAFSTVTPCLVDGVSQNIEVVANLNGGGGSGRVIGESFALGDTDTAGDPVVEVVLEVHSVSLSFNGTHTQAFVDAEWHVYVDRVGVEVSGVCPGILDFEISGASPNGEVHLGAAEMDGMMTITGSHPCAGSRTDLSIDGQVRAVLQADADGNASFSRLFRNARQCGIAVQAIDISTCETSNLLFPLAP